MPTKQSRLSSFSSSFAMLPIVSLRGGMPFADEAISPFSLIEEVRKPSLRLHPFFPPVILSPFFCHLQPCFFLSLRAADEAISPLSFPRVTASQLCEAVSSLKEIASVASLPRNDRQQHKEQPLAMTGNSTRNGSLADGSPFQSLGSIRSGKYTFQLGLLTNDKKRYSHST